MELIDNGRAAENVRRAYEVAEDIYILGCLANGVTVFRQQVRALNLGTALSFRFKANERIAVVGGGIAGLTLVAALLALMPRAKITLFESRMDLCPLQQGAETRWLHPHIYDWPAVGSRAPRANLPLLDWGEGTAGEVAHTLLRQFSDVVDWSRSQDKANAASTRLSLLMGVTHLRIASADRRVEWVGTKGNLMQGHVVLGQTSGASEQFDAIVIASGFGTEVSSGKIDARSYWRNDTLGQPVLNGTKETFLISGFGDGAIVDLCRLTIERFRHGRILEDIWGNKVNQVEDRLRKKGFSAAVDGSDLRNAYNNSPEFSSIVSDITTRLKTRLRKDTLVVLHLGGKPPSRNSSIWDAVSGRSSFLNKLLLLGLFEAGALVPRFAPLATVRKEFGVKDHRLIIRHGVAPQREVLGLFVDADMITSSLERMQSLDNQVPKELWPLGYFPHIPRKHS